MMTSKTNLSLIRRYILEIAVIVLAGVVGKLYIEVGNLNVFIRENLLQQNSTYQRTIEENTNALNNFFYNQKPQR